MTAPSTSTAAAGTRWAGPSLPLPPAGAGTTCTVLDGPPAAHAYALLTGRASASTEITWLLSTRTVVIEASPGPPGDPATCVGVP